MDCDVAVTITGLLESCWTLMKNRLSKNCSGLRGRVLAPLGDCCGCPPEQGLLKWRSAFALRPFMGKPRQLSTNSIGLRHNVGCGGTAFQRMGSNRLAGVEFAAERFALALIVVVAGMNAEEDLGVDCRIEESRFCRSRRQGWPSQLYSSQCRPAGHDLRERRR
jgi:hypothetical protein